ncbi:MAG TPA: hypothetical protein VLA16_15760 [Ideonella sp.]|nr:hypothetical protein [Ideonella sp.]
MAQPTVVLERIAAAMGEVLLEARGDARIPSGLLGEMARAWHDGMRHGARR